ncbi:hypothetical protein MNBD_GAMMA01-501, partial [hydrothermal vent metagenome]
MSHISKKKLTLLILVSSFAFASGVGRISFDSHQDVNLKSIDLIFANGFEAAVVGTYSSDTIAPSSEIPAIEAGSATVGSIAGSFQTDQMGQANYSIPILTAAGTAGLAPQVALNYSSGGGNGAIGVGWSVSGVTMITR